MDTQQQQQQTDSENQPNLAAMWEQMGAATGTLIGKFIGLNAQIGLEMLDSLVVNPLQQSYQNQQAVVPEEQAPSPALNQPAADGQEAGIRTKVWTEMGREYGQTIGNAIGLAMDNFVISVDNSIMQPLAAAEQAKGEQSGSSGQQQKSGEG